MMKKMILLLMLILAIVSCEECFDINTGTEDASSSNDVPVIMAKAYIISEITNNGILDTVQVRDTVTQGVNVFRIVSGNIDSVFSIDRYSGALSIVEDSKLDYEKTTDYFLEIEVEDSCANPVSAVGIFHVKVLDEQVATDGLMLYLPFNGDLLDYSPYKNHAIGTKTPVYTAGQREQAVFFDGLNDYLVLSKDINCEAGLSFSFWYKPMKPYVGENNGTIISKYDMALGRCFSISSLYPYDNSIYAISGSFYSGSNTDFARSYVKPESMNLSSFNNYAILNQQYIEKDQWYHCVFNVTESDFQVWINGIQCCSNIRKFDNYRSHNEVMCVIGNTPNQGEGNNNHFHGVLDELRIYNRRMSVEEIQILYKE